MSLVNSPAPHPDAVPIDGPKMVRIWGHRWFLETFLVPPTPPDGFGKHGPPIHRRWPPTPPGIPAREQVAGGTGSVCTLHRKHWSRQANAGLCIVSPPCFDLGSHRRARRRISHGRGSTNGETPLVTDCGAALRPQIPLFSEFPRWWSLWPNDFESGTEIDPKTKTLRWQLRWSKLNRSESWGWQAN